MEAYRQTRPSYGPPYPLGRWSSEQVVVPQTSVRYEICVSSSYLPVLSNPSTSSTFGVSADCSAYILIPVVNHAVPTKGARGSDSRTPHFRAPCTKGRQQNNNFVLTSLGGAVSCSGNVLARRSFRFPRALESNGVDCVEVLRNTIEDYANPKFKKAIFIMYSTVLQYVFIYYYMVYPRLFFQQRRTVYRVTRYVRYPGVS